MPGDIGKSEETFFSCFPPEIPGAENPGAGGLTVLSRPIGYGFTETETTTK